MFTLIRQELYKLIKKQVPGFACYSCSLLILALLL